MRSNLSAVNASYVYEKSYPYHAPTSYVCMTLLYLYEYVAKPLNR